MAAQVATTAPTPTWSPLVGRCFLNPTLDYLLIGAGLCLPFALWVTIDPSITPQSFQTKIVAFLLFNYTHFAASTVRLYTKPGEISSRAWVWYGLPIVGLIVTTLCIMWPQVLGKHLWSLYLTWSPYHYAAQAYGLALMYSFRSGVYLDSTEKRIFWGICMIPFIRAMLIEEGRGLGWFVNITYYPSLLPYINATSIVLAVLVFAMPIIVFFRLRDRGKTMPAICWLILATNGLWWVALSYSDAWFWATIFHSLQYIVIICIVHTNDAMERPDNKYGRTFHVVTFYGVSMLLGIFLFLVWPWLYVPFGFDLKASMLMTVATINLHHFIVDGYIWRSKKKKKAPNPAAEF